MADYEIIRKEKKDDITVFTPETEQQIDKVFNSLIEINEKNIIVRKACKLCSHPLRFEAEQKWEESNFDYSQSCKWVNDEIKKHNEENELSKMWDYIPLQNFRSHMKEHYKEQERQIRLKEYAKKIEEVVKIKQNKEKLLEVGLAVCFENLGRIASIETYGDIKSEKARSDSINKIMATMMGIIDLQTKIEGEIATAEMVHERLSNVWVNFINKQDSDAKKAILLEMLEDFSVHFGKTP